MEKAVVSITAGMLSVFSSFVFAQEIAIDHVTSHFGKFGIAGGFAIIFGICCILGAVRWYRDLQEEIKRRDAIIEEREKSINELILKNIKLTGELAKFKERSRNANYESGDEDE
jgi:hypothetical protein